MKKLFTATLVFVIMCFALKTHAQVSLYSFASGIGAYVPITGTLIDSSRGTSGAASLDDVLYTAQNIGFDFVMNGGTYSTYSFNTNGQLAFGTGLTGTNYSPISGTLTYPSCIAAMARDLQGIFGFAATRTISSTTLTGVSSFEGIVVGKLVLGTGIATGTLVTGFNTGLGEVYISIAATSSGSSTLNCASAELRSETTGAVGSRVHTLQFSNFKRFSSSTLIDNFNFQIKLYETTNIIEVVYGSNQANSTAITPQVGLRGINNTDFNNRTTATDWTATSAGGVNTATCTLNDLVFPPSGLEFSWTPPIINNDVAPTENVAPLKIEAGDPGVFPEAKIKNLGINDQNVPFATVYKITGPVNYQDSTFETLLAGQEKTITFPSLFVPGAVGNYAVTIYTRLPGDQVSFNDTLKTSFSVNPEANYGNGNGYFYANNLAVNQPSYPTWGWKDTSGSRSIIIDNIVQPGITRVGSTNDDAYFVLSLKQMLLEFNQDTTDKHLKFNGICFDSIFPGTNGIIGLTQQFGTYSINDFNIDGAQVANNAILAFWHDANFGNLQGGSNRLSYKVKHNQLLITYDRAVSFSPTTDWVSYQVVIEIAKGCAAPNSNWRVTFADTTNQNTSSSFYDNYIAQTTATLPDPTVFRNYVMGWSGVGVNNIYSGYVSTGNPFPASPVTQVKVKRPVFDANGIGLAVEFGPDQNELNLHDVVYLDLSLSLEGLQSNGRVRDTVEVIIRDGNSAPYKIMQRTKVYLDSAHNGTFAYGRKVIEATVIKDQYPLLLEVRHRNSITTWSNIFIANSVAIAYNFTIGLPQIYGNNGTMVNGAASYFAGDVNGDQVVDLADVALIDNDAFNFVAGDYVITDVNWDGVVDLVDAAIADNNAFNFVSEVKFPGAVRPFTEEPVNYNYKAPAEIKILPDAYAEPKIDLNAVQNIDIKKED
ncbi:MAG: dockerin type I repeat-containing protein [Ignavibacteria bacterium]|nr:dockerin type I repeat-containing protein [Ignavibacteria bacterium]